jgi:peroxiredoxin
MGMKKNAIIIAVVSIMAVILLVWFNGKGDSESNAEAVQSSMVAPKITLASLEGTSYKLPILERKPAVVFFWASWCSGCNKEAPEMVKMHEQYKDKVDIYGVNLTHMDTVEDAEKFKEKYGIPFPVLMDKKGEAAEAYKVRGTPTTVFIDTHGLIQDKAIGFPGAKALDKKIQTLIAVGEEDVHE